MAQDLKVPLFTHKVDIQLFQSHLLRQFAWAGIAAYAFNPNTQEVDICEFEVILVYIVSSRIARATERPTLPR